MPDQPANPSRPSFRQRSVVGLLRDPEVYRLLDSRAVPYVTTWTIDPDSPHPQVGVDYRAAARDMVRHHLDNGHTEFGLIDLPARHNDRSTSRRDGYREAIEAGGGRLCSGCIVECPIDFIEGGRAFELLMDRPTPPTAILCGGDVFALGALMAAPRRGLVVPRDVSISGFDNHGMSAMVMPSLTTIDLPIRETGVAAAQYLLDRIAGRPVEHRALFGHRVLAGDSTAAPPDRAKAGAGPARS